jgi:hypothetical protein
MDVGAAFGMIFAVIVLAFVLLLGTGQITNIMCTSSIAQTSKEVKNIEAMVDDIQASGSGSSDTIQLRIASNAEICFVDPSDPRPNIVGGWLPDPDLYPVIESKIQTERINVWIDYNCGSTEPGYNMDYIVTSMPGQTGNFCARAGDTLLLTNIGSQVRIEKLA